MMTINDIMVLILISQVKKKRALRDLESNKNLILNPSDMDGNLVVPDHPQYKKMVLDILSDQQ